MQRGVSTLTVPEYPRYNARVFDEVYHFSNASGTWVQPSEMPSSRIDCACIQTSPEHMVFAAPTTPPLAPSPLCSALLSFLLCSLHSFYLLLIGI